MRKVESEKGELTSEIGAGSITRKRKSSIGDKGTADSTVRDGVVESMIALV